MAKWTKERVSELREMLLSGETVAECAIRFERDRATIYQTIKLHLPELKEDEFGQGLKRIIVRRSRKEDSERAKTDVGTAKERAFKNKAINAKKSKWEFTITMADIEWPTHCPVLGIELDWLSSCRTENTPSFDRVDPTKGYIPGNVAIISWRANRIKNDGTAEEHKKISDWLNCKVESNKHRNSPSAYNNIC